MIRLSVVLDEWAAPSQSSPAAQISWGLDYISARYSWQLDAMLAARIQAPGPLILVTGI